MRFPCSAFGACSQIGKGELPRRSAVGMPWEVVTDMPDMTIRSGHYTALLETIGAGGATKLHADEREQLLAVADALLFGDPTAISGSPRRWTWSRAGGRASGCRRRTALSCASTSAAADRCPRGPERGGAPSVRRRGIRCPIARADRLGVPRCSRGAVQLAIGAAGGCRVRGVCPRVLDRIGARRPAARGHRRAR